MSWPSKDPNDVADYTNTWTLDAGDAIATSAWTFAVQAGLTKQSDDFTGNVARIWLTGGTDGQTAVLINRVTTTIGRTFDSDPLYLPIAETYPPQVLTPGYIIPNPTTLKAFFPAFSGVPNSVILFWIERATRMVDETWFEGDYAQAIMLLACHYMVGAGLGTGAEAQVNAEGMAGFQTIRSGQLTLSRGATSQSDASMGEWGATTYGRAYYWLLRRNKPGGVAAVGDACLDIHPWWNGIFIAQGRFP